MSGSPTLFVALVGPPAVGKSTISQPLVAHLAGTVFRLREFTDDLRRRGELDERLFETTDPLGWLSHGAVAMVVEAAFTGGHFPVNGRPVVLENFPGTGAQLTLLLNLVGTSSAQLGLVELTAPDDIVAARARTRRVCISCEPDPRGDPHRPARPAADAPDRCARCGGRLAPRLADDPARFAERLQRFRSHIGAIRATAHLLGLPYTSIDATDDPATCLAQAKAAVDRLLPLSDYV
jgi:adenylate kinase